MLHSLSQHSPEPQRSPAQRVLQLLEPGALETAAIREFALATGADAQHSPDWDSEPGYEAWIQSFQNAVESAIPLYLQVPRSERPQLLGRIFVQLLRDTSPVHQAPVLRALPFSQIIGYPPGLPAEVRELVLPHCIKAAADNIRRTGNSGGLGIILTYEELASTAIQDAVKDILLPLLRDEEPTASPASGITLSAFLTQEDIIPSRPLVLADAEVVAAGQQYLLREIDQGVRPWKVTNDAELLRQQNFLSAEVLPAARRVIERDLRVPSSIPHRGDAGIGQASDQGPFLEAAIEKLILLPLYRTKTGSFPAETDAMLAALAPQAEKAVVAVLSSIVQRPEPIGDRLNQVRSAIEVFASNEFRQSDTLANLIDAIAERLPFRSEGFAEHAENLILCAPELRKPRTVEWLQQRAGEAARVQLQTIDGKMRSRPSDDGLVFLDQAFAHLARCIAVTAPAQARGPAMLKACNLSPGDLGRYRNQIISYLHAERTVIEERSAALDQLAQILTDGEIISTECRELFVRVCGLKNFEEDTGDSAVTKIAISLEGCIASADASDDRGHDQRNAYGTVAFDLQSAAVADELRGIDRRILLAAGARMRRAYDDRVASDRQQSMVTESDAAWKSYEQPHEPHLLARREPFYALLASYSLFRQWADREWAQEYLKKMFMLCEQDSAQALQHGYELLAIQRQHEAWVGDGRGGADVELLIATRHWDSTRIMNRPART